jgi:hypothetical protein
MGQGKPPLRNKTGNFSLLGSGDPRHGQISMRALLTTLVAAFILYCVDLALNDGRYSSQLFILARHFGTSLGFPV